MLIEKKILKEKAKSPNDNKLVECADILSSHFQQRP